MAPDETPTIENGPTQTSAASRVQRRGRRSGRGRRRRGRGPRRPAPQERPPEGEEEVLSAEAAAAEPGAAHVAEPSQVEAEVTTPKVQPRRAASPDAIQEALAQINQITDNLRQALEDMEEVLETVELAERQKQIDEQEIQALRNSLRRLQRPREGGHVPQHGHSG